MDNAMEKVQIEVTQDELLWIVKGLRVTRNHLSSCNKPLADEIGELMEEIDAGKRTWMRELTDYTIT